VAGTDGRWHRRRAVAALALLIAVGIIVAVVLRASSSPPSRPAGAAGSSSATTTVRRRDLVETDSEPGTLGHTNQQTVYNRLGGTITWLPSVGQVITPGQALFRIAGEPVILMNGRTPAYRELGPSDGDALDVLELNRNLVALGFNPEGIVVDDAWQAATTAGVDALQASLGETETGTIKLGRLVFLPGDRLVSSISAQLGSQAALRVAQPASQFVSLTTTGTTSVGVTTPTGTPVRHHHALTPNTLAALLELLRAETAQLKAAEAQLRAARSPSPHSDGGTRQKGNPSPASDANRPKNTPSSVSPGAGNASAGSATAVMTTSSARLVVTVQLDPSKQSEAKVGRHVRVKMPSGATVAGRISAVSPPTQSPNGNSGAGGSGTPGSGSSTTVPVTIVLRGHPSGRGLDHASVTVTFAQARAQHGLSVPVTALLATQGGRYVLQEAASPHRLIAVTLGLFAAGYVEISGTGVHPGLMISDSEG
jgi:hypothetical protein